LLGRTLLPRTPLLGATRGAFWGTGPFVCPLLVQIPIASITTKQNAGNLRCLINFLCSLNIINALLLQASTETLSKLFRHGTNYLMHRKSQASTLYEICRLRNNGGRTNPAGMLQSVIRNLQSEILHRGLSSVGRAPQWHQ
jgi:hypothetical protein